MPDPTPHPTSTATTADPARIRRTDPNAADRRTAGRGDRPQATGDTARAEVAEQFRYFARHRAGDYAPLYARLGQVIADETDLLDLALLARPGQSRPDLLLAVLHELLLRDPEHPAARFYPSLTTHPDDGDPGPDVVALARAHHDRIAAEMGRRLVQTNEVGRCTFLAPAIRTAATHAATSTDRATADPAEAGQVQLALLEIGASAGLNLLLDHYSYRYYDDTDPARAALTAGEAQPQLILGCALDGPGQPPLEPSLNITWRAGIDLHPLDIDKPDDRLWLRALVWPDHRDRAAQLHAALHVAATAPRPALHAGDAAPSLADVAATAPDDAHLVIYHSAVLAHMPAAARDGVTTAVLALSTTRPVSWVQAEPRSDNDPRRLRLTRCHGGRVIAEHALGSYHPHGLRLRWD